MFSESRIAIYEYLKSLFASVTQNIYSMRVPTENTDDDTKNGFIVIQVGGINAVIRSLVDNPQNDSPYFVQGDGILSMDDDEDTNKGNQYNVFVKSFIVVSNN